MYIIWKTSIYAQKSCNSIYLEKGFMLLQKFGDMTSFFKFWWILSDDFLLHDDKGDDDGDDQSDNWWHF